MMKPLLTVVGLALSPVLRADGGPTYAPQPDYLELAYYGVLAASTTILKLSTESNPKADKAFPEIFGRCYLSSGGTKSIGVCRDAYILFTDLASHQATRVWISNSDGRFSFRYKAGQRFTLQAIAGEARSNVITVTKPAEVTLNLETQTR